MSHPPPSGRSLNSKALWRRWRRFAHRAAEVQSHALLLVLYFVVLLYSAFTAFLGFEVNEGEYKVMGMAPDGTPRYVDRIWKIVRSSRDGSFELDLDYFSFEYSTSRTFSDRLISLFGPPRRPDAPLFTERSGYPSYFGARPSNFVQLQNDNQHYADVAASIQAVTEDLLLWVARAAHQKTGSTALCMAGGVALNSVANGRILRETPITDLYVQPSAGDGGAAVGAALFASGVLLGEPRFVMEHAYWGEAPPRMRLLFWRAQRAGAADARTARSVVARAGRHPDCRWRDGARAARSGFPVSGNSGGAVRLAGATGDCERVRDGPRPAWVTRDYRERLRDARRSHPAVVFLGDSCAEFSSYPRLVAERLQTLAPAFDQVTKLNVPGWSSEQELVPLHHAYIDATRQAAAATNTSLCDAAAEADARGAARSTLLRADGIHFTSAGDGFMADVVSCCIQRLPP